MPRTTAAAERAAERHAAEPTLGISERRHPTEPFPGRADGDPTCTAMEGIGPGDVDKVVLALMLLTLREGNRTRP